MPHVVCVSCVPSSQCAVPSVVLWTWFTWLPCTFAVNGCPSSEWCARVCECWHPSAWRDLGGWCGPAGACGGGGGGRERLKVRQRGVLSWTCVRAGRDGLCVDVPAPGIADLYWPARRVCSLGHDACDMHECVPSASRVGPPSRGATWPCHVWLDGGEHNPRFRREGQRGKAWSAQWRGVIRRGRCAAGRWLWGLWRLHDADA